MALIKETFPLLTGSWKYIHVPKKANEIQSRLLHKQLVKSAFFLFQRMPQKSRRSLLAVYYHMGTIYLRMMLPWGAGVGRGMKARKDYIFLTLLFQQKQIQDEVDLTSPSLMCAFTQLQTTISSGLPVSSFPSHSLSTSYHFGLRRTGSISVFATKNFEKLVQ